MKAKIDWEKRQIIGRSGKVYRIAPETLSTGRTPEFEIRSIALAYRTDFETLLKLIRKVKGVLRDGRTFGEVADALNLLEKFEQGMINFQLNNRSELVEFCSLFCIGENEDVGVHTEDIIIEKYEDWREIPEVDFFLLCTKAISSFRQRYLEIMGIKQEQIQELEQNQK